MLGMERLRRVLGESVFVRITNKYKRADVETGGSCRSEWIKVFYSGTDTWKERMKEEEPPKERTVEVDGD